MLALQRSLSLGYLQQRWMRTILVVLSIALGVATMVATRTLNRNLNLAAQTAVNPLSGLTDLLVVNGQAGVPIEEARKLDPYQKDGSNPVLAAIRDVQPMVVGRVLLPDLDNRSVLLIGLQPPSGEQALQELPAGLEFEPFAAIDKLKIGLALLFGGGPVAVSDQLAKDLGLTPADNANIDPAKALFHVRMAGVEMKALAVGVVHTKTRDILPEPNVLFMQVSAASKFVYPQRPNYVTQINVSLQDGADKEAVSQQLQEILGPPLKVQTLAATNEKVRDITAGLELGFAIGGVGALVVGLFLVYNALSVSVAERRHDIGILRSVGATRGQIAGLFVVEALVLGLIGSLLGLPIGYGLACIAQGPISRTLSDTLLALQPPDLALDNWTIGLALVAGIMTTILASLVPALQAASAEPADVVRRVPPVYHLLYRLIHCSLILLLLLGGLVSVVWRERLPLRFGAFAGIVFILVAGLFAMPLLAIIAGKILQPFFRLFLGLEGRLAADNMVRSPGRTGLVIGALAATTALMVETAGFIRSSEHAILTYLDESIAADFFVTSGSRITEAARAIPMDEKLGDRLRAMPEVDAVLGIRFNALPFRDRLVLMLALDASAFAKAEHPHSLGRNLTRFPRLREPGTALVSENFAALYKVKVGEKITVDGLEGPLQLEVIGTVVDYTWNRGTILVSREWFRRTFRDHQVDIFDVYLKHQDGQPADETRREEVIARLSEKLDPKDAVFAVTRANFRQAATKQLQRVYSLAYAQQAVVGLVALLGVISALFISVLQRRRELGLLRAVGASRDQVLRSVLAEAVLMGMVGAILGLLIGIVLEWYLIGVMLLDESGLVIPMLIPWQAAGVVGGLAVLLATAVGLWPAWQATRIRIAEAIAYE
jgi:putative ABC transport system permease protein